MRTKMGEARRQGREPSLVDRPPVVRRAQALPTDEKHGAELPLDQRAINGAGPVVPRARCDEGSTPFQTSHRALWRAAATVCRDELASSRRRDEDV